MLKKQQSSRTSKRSNRLIKLLMLYGVSFQQRLSLQRCRRLTMKLILLLIKNLKLLEDGATHLRDNGDVSFYLSARAL